jgi:hypothetical protein
LHTSVVDEYEVAIVKVVDENENTVDLLVVVDREVIARRVHSAGGWEVLVPGWKVRDDENGKIDFTPPEQRVTLH